jgi:tRNA threonylcarbamoyladenosine biosynthesis protein TsaE
MSTQTIEIKDVSELPKVASIILEHSQSTPVIIFNGEMGAGKTTLISQLCKQMGISEDISSPTYAIVNTYLTTESKEVYHFDFYRLSDEMEAVQSGLDEMIDSGNTCLIEWAERIMKLLPVSYVRVNISITGMSSRKIEITKV